MAARVRRKMDRATALVVMRIFGRNEHSLAERATEEPHAVASLTRSTRARVSSGVCK